MAPAAQYHHDGSTGFAHQDAAGHMPTAGVYRNGSKRLRTNDYHPSSSSLRGPMSSPAGDFDHRAAQPVDQNGNMFAPAMYQQSNGFPSPHTQQMPSQYQVDIAPDGSWVGASANTQQGYGVPLQPVHGQPTPQVNAHERYEPEQPPGMRGYMPNLGLHSGTNYQPFFSIDNGLLPGSMRVNPQFPAEDYNKTLGWPDAKWACSTFGTSGTAIGMFQDAAELYGKDASQHLKLQSLTILDNLASQIIHRLAKPSLTELEKLSAGSDSDERQAYTTQKDLFEQTRRVYRRDSPFINAVAAQLTTPYQQEVVRKANRATFISCLLEAHDVSLHDLDDYFLDIFVPQGQRLLKWQGAIFLELKTQAYVFALLSNEPNLSSLLDYLFPADIEDRIIARHSDAPHLVPSEQDFVERMRARKQYLQAEPIETAVHTLPIKYVWQEFLKEFAVCIHKNLEYLLSSPHRSTSSAPSNAPAEALQRGTPSSVGGSAHSPGMAPAKQAQVSQGAGSTEHDTGRGFSSFGALVPEPDMAAAGVHPGHVHTKKASSANKEKSPPATAVPAGAASSSEAPQKVVTTVRQPWKQEEEDALLAGLEEVNGPYWSRILSLYGRGGSKSEVLKDRTQIQLKDKARNLKLWHLKIGLEVPACLQGVTGELRKRGGAKLRAQLEAGGEVVEGAKKAAQ